MNGWFSLEVGWGVTGSLSTPPHTSQVKMGEVKRYGTDHMYNLRESNLLKCAENCQHYIDIKVDVDNHCPFNLAEFNSRPDQSISKAVRVLALLCAQTQSSAHSKPYFYWPKHAWQ